MPKLYRKQGARLTMTNKHPTSGFKKGHQYIGVKKPKYINKNQEINEPYKQHGIGIVNKQYLELWANDC